MTGNSKAWKGKSRGEHFVKSLGLFLMGTLRSKINIMDLSNYTETKDSFMETQKYIYLCLVCDINIYLSIHSLFCLLYMLFYSMLIKDRKAPWWRLEEHNFGLYSHFGIAPHEGLNRLTYCSHCNLEESDLKSNSLKEANIYFTTFCAGAYRASCYQLTSWDNR